MVPRTPPLELRAPAKLNLFLEVLGRRADGYHEIDSIVQAISLHDTVRLERADSISLTVEGEAPEDRTNLAWRAAEAVGVGARIHLVKRIPVGAGLGGGSSDAATVLLGLDALYGLGLRRERLLEIAARLGADVPFFVFGGLARCRGIGERVEPLPRVPSASFLLACPDLVSATARVYGSLPPELTGEADLASLFEKRYMGGERPLGAPYFNRLQSAAEGLQPRLAEVREELGRVFGRVFTMTGSGAAYFAPAGPADLGETALVAAGARVKVRKVDAIGP